VGLVVAEVVDGRIHLVADTKITLSNGDEQWMRHVLAQTKADLEARIAADEQRFSDLQAEWDRQYGAIEQRREELAWAARYLPAPIRRRILSSGSVLRHPYGRPKSDSFVAAVDQTAAELGLTPYTEGK
jgi:hypothetical protein